MRTILNHIGIAQHHVLGSDHHAGTCRLGTAPAMSVLSYCEAHELDNLHLVDTSVFPSIGAVNPALTSVAKAIRARNHLNERLS